MLRVLVPAAACATALVALPMAPAHADDSRADLTGISASNIVVASGNCKYTPVTVAWSVEPGYEVMSANADVYRGTQVVDSHDVSQDGNYLWCPYLDGLGTFRFGPHTQVDFYDQDFNEYLATDDTTGTFAAKLQARLYQTVTKSGTRVTVKVVHQRYDLSRNAYVGWAPSSTKLQYQLSNGSWYTYKTLGNTGTSGTFSFYTSAVRNYRAVSTSSWNVWGRVSATVRK